MTTRRIVTSYGFSLVELMMVIGIISMLAIMAWNSTEQIKIIAKRSLAASDLSYIRTLIVAYQESAGGMGYGYQDAGNYNAASAPTGDFTIRLSTRTTTDKTSCHTNNVYNFKPTDCRKIGYSYLLAFRQDMTTGSPATYHNTSDGSWYLRADSTKALCPLAGMDRFWFCPGTQTLCLKNDAIKNQCGTVSYTPPTSPACHIANCAGQY